MALQCLHSMFNELSCIYEQRNAADYRIRYRRRLARQYHSERALRPTGRYDRRERDEAPQSRERD